MIITIDGSAGSGKSTVARKIANNTGLIHLNSGALFRAVAVNALRSGLALDDELGVAKVASSLSFDFLLDENKETKFLVNGLDAAAEISAEEVGESASLIAILPQVRELLLKVQHQVAEKNVAEGRALVVEGRDSGTVVFPNADKKFYLHASPEVRARRRYEQLSHLGNITYERLLDDMRKRDLRDANREIAPQRKAEEAVLVDTSNLGIEEVVNLILQQLPKV
ncbi:MAG: (d)CMP kinase [Proteobacteria bacterium]|nr:(d)CMP kinase [Pseudomonadota bacterium]